MQLPRVMHVGSKLNSVRDTRADNKKHSRQNALHPILSQLLTTGQTHVKFYIVPEDALTQIVCKTSADTMDKNMYIWCTKVQFTSCNSNSMEILPWSYPNFDKKITTNFCACHDSCADVACAKIGLIARIGIVENKFSIASYIQV